MGDKNWIGRYISSSSLHLLLAYYCMPIQIVCLYPVRKEESDVMLEIYALLKLFCFCVTFRIFCYADTLYFAVLTGISSMHHHRVHRA